MQYYEINENSITCLLCHHYCKIKEGKVGICGVNKNTGDKIECLVYGYPAAINIDPVEKKPLYHFLPNTKTFSLGTVGCNFSCSFCQNHGISQEHHVNKSHYYCAQDIVDLAIQNNCQSISYTYNEPTIFYPYAKDIAILAKQKGLKNIFVSNGFESTEMINDMVGIIDAANIDLKSFNASYYKKNLHGNLEKILENLKLFKKNGIWIEITTLIIPTINDSIEELTQIAQFIAKELGADTPWHLSAFHPDYKEQDLPNTPIQTLQKAYEIGKEAGLHHVYIGNANIENPTLCTNCGYELLNRKRFALIKNDLQYKNLCPKCHTPLQGIFMNNRKAVFAGSFYPNNCNEINKMIHHFNSLLQQHNINTSSPFQNIKAIIAPHAGYIYSGFTANIAYKILQNHSFKRFVVIGPSHKIAFEGASVSIYDEYQCVCENLKIDTPLAQELINEFDFVSHYDQVHQEHSTETQIPFIQHYFPNASALELIYGKCDPSQIEQVIDYVMKLEDTMLVISTDLSHFYDLQTAKSLDNICLESISKLDIATWEKGCEACGRIGVKALISYAKKHNIHSQLLDYRTSADTSKDTSRVVGYTSAIFGN